MRNPKPMLIWGNGGLGREVNVLCETLGIPVAGYLDLRPEMKGEMSDGVKVLGDILDPDINVENYQVTFAVGDSALRKRMYEKTLATGMDIAEALIHPSVIYSARSLQIGPGSVICPGCVIMVNVSIGTAVVINQLCSIGHDLILNDFVTLSPSVSVSGNVSIGEGSYLGVGCSIREGIQIGNWAVIGGGAFVKDNVPDKVLMAGVPAIIKKFIE